MTDRRIKDRMTYPSQVVGWLNIWDVEGEIVQKYLTDGRKPIPVFEPFYCILRQDLKTLLCHRSEEDVEDIPGLVNLPVHRLDGGKYLFDRRWGYEALETIKENLFQHCAMMSTERLYRSKLDSAFNESLPDLTQSYDSALFPKRKHVFKKFFRKFALKFHILHDLITVSVLLMKYSLFVQFYWASLIGVF